MPTKNSLPQGQVPAFRVEYKFVGYVIDIPSTRIEYKFLEYSTED